MKPGFVDLHAHILFGTDDGAQDPATMCAMLDAAYQSGTRVLCATPHYHPGYFGETKATSESAFSKLCAYAERYTDLTLVLGNELRFAPGCTEWLAAGICRTLGDTRCVLVDFSAMETETRIVRGMKEILSAGYQPILAHAERYRRLTGRGVGELIADGVLLTLDADSLFGGDGCFSKRRAFSLLRQGAIFAVASDMHGIKSRPPSLMDAYQIICKKFGSDYADELFIQNPHKILPSGKDRGNNE